MKMSKKMRIVGTRAIFGVVLSLAFYASSFSQAKEPVIIIPGLTGSELVNQRTGEVVWFKVGRSKDDNLRLPISPNIALNRDSLVPGDIIRKVKVPLLPDLDVYSGLIDALKTRDGYHEENWANPTVKGSENSIYVFPYDWRRDNVENARLLIRKIEALKRKLRRPNLKFNIIAHSMGGIIARYAAMYGDADLPAGNGKPVPTWAGTRNIDKIILMGTPNEGSALSLESLVTGLAIGGLKVNIPFVQNLSRFDILTIPSAFQLLPAPGTLKVLDESLKPIQVDLYDPAVWARYDWNPIDDKDFAKKFSGAERRNAPAYFRAALARAKRLHEALTAGANDSKPGPPFYLIGSNCRDSLDSIIVYEDKKSGKWKTLFKPAGFTRSDGVKVSADDTKKVLYTKGDGTVTQGSLEASVLSTLLKVTSILRPTASKLVCEDHDKLPLNVEIQDYMIGILNGKGAPASSDKPVAKPPGVQ